MVSDRRGQPAAKPAVVDRGAERVANPCRRDPARDRPGSRFASVERGGRCTLAALFLATLVLRVVVLWRSRRRFLSHAQLAERFIDPGSFSTLHRVRAARFVSRGLVLELALSTSFAAVLPATLDVLTADEPAGPLRWQSRRVAPWQRQIVLALPRRPARVLVKCEGPHVFFHQAGWRAFDLRWAPLTASSPSTMRDAAAVVHASR